VDGSMMANSVVERLVVEKVVLCKATRWVSAALSSLEHVR
jgi:hypothetical protein